MKVNKGALPLIMGNYASNFGINLYMYGSSAYTDGKNITIPRLNLDDADEMDMAFGYVAHECGHVRYSDFNVIHSAYDRSTALALLFNALEDSRIEALQMKNWPGLQKTFNHIISKLDGTLCSYLKRCRNKVSLITTFFDCSNRFHCLHQPSGNSLKAARMKLKKILPEALITALEEKAWSSVNCRNSEEVFSLSRDIMSVLIKSFELLNKEYERKSEEKKFAGSDDLADDMDADKFLRGDRQEDSLDLMISGLRRISVNELVAGSVPNDEDISAAGMNEYEKIISSINGENSRQLSGKTRLKAQKDMVKIISKMKEPVTINEYSRADSRQPSLASVIEDCSAGSKSAVDIGSLVSRNSEPAKTLSLYKKVLSDNSLRSNISQLVKGYEDWHFGATSSGKTLDIRRYQYTSGGKLSDNVFKKKMPKKALNTSVHLLVDISGSMNRPCQEGSSTTRSQVANHLALSMAMSLESVRNVDNRVIYFPGNYCEYEEVYHSGQPLVERATYFDLAPRGCTPLAQALMYSMSQMPSVDKYHRNIIIVITDGEPDNFSFARQMLEKAKEQSIEVYALRVSPQREKLRDLFEESVDIQEASELPTALTTLLADKVFNYN